MDAAIIANMSLVHKLVEAGVVAANDNSKLDERAQIRSDQLPLASRSTLLHRKGLLNREAVRNCVCSDLNAVMVFVASLMNCGRV
jgi:hypothetical protein